MHTNYGLAKLIIFRQSISQKSQPRLVCRKQKHCKAVVPEGDQRYTATRDYWVRCHIVDYIDKKWNNG